MAGFIYEREGHEASVMNGEGAVYTPMILEAELVIKVAILLQQHIFSMTGRMMFSAF